MERDYAIVVSGPSGHGRLDPLGLALEVRIARCRKGDDGAITTTCLDRRPR
jgi:hypothetical protein